MRSYTSRSGAYGRLRRLARAFGGGSWVPASILLTGCFTLSPVRFDGDVDPGRVRIHLTDAGATHVSTVLGERTAVVDADLLRSTPSEFVVLVPSTGHGSFGSEVLYQELRIPKQELEGMQRRTLNRTRTALVIGGVGAVAGLLLYQSFSGKTGGSIPGTNPGPSESRIPILQFQLP